MVLRPGAEAGAEGRTGVCELWYHTRKHTHIPVVTCQVVALQLCIVQIPVREVCGPHSVDSEFGFVILTVDHWLFKRDTLKTIVFIKTERRQGLQ